MIALASEYKAFLSTSELVATGTTGGRLANESA
jgi:methylglyoxal synthase